jgi:hypothetical protein
MKYFFDKDNIPESDKKLIMQVTDDVKFDKIKHALEEVDLNGEEKDDDEKDIKENEKKSEEKTDEVNNTQKKKNKKKKKK